MAIFIVMGVSGVGKTSVAKALAQRLNGTFLDADDFHPESNKQKMAQGIPLTDADRWGWLDALNQELLNRSAQTLENAPIVLACSALKDSYRAQIEAGLRDVRVIFLKASYEVVRQRIAARHDHFMPASLLSSQFDALEAPAAASALIVDASQSVDEIVKGILQTIST